MREEGFVVVKEKKHCLLGCLFRLVTFAVAVYGTVTALAKIMKRLSRRLEEDNEGSESKRFFSCLTTREICLDDGEASYLDVTAVAACVELDLSEAILPEESFVKVHSLGGKVVIKVPAMTRVELEGKGVVCGFSNMVPGYEDESLPVIYVDAESLGACLKIKIAEE